MRSVLVLGLLGCSGGAAKTTSSPAPRPTTVDAPDAVVGKRSHFIYGVRGGDPELVPWSGAGRVTLDGGRAFVLDRVDGRGRIQAVAGRPAHSLGAKIDGEHPGSGLGATGMAGTTSPVVIVGELVVVQGRSETPPASSPVAAPPLLENYLVILEHDANGLGKRLQRVPWPATRTALLASTDVDGDGRPDLVTYECAQKCTVGFWRATATQLDAEKPIATWDKQPRVVVGAKRGTSYFLVAVEPFAIESYVFVNGAPFPILRVDMGTRDERSALDGPVAIGDFDNDKRADIVVVSRGNALYAWSDGKPVPQLATVFQDRIRQVALVDLDRDGDDDLLVATDGDVAMYRGSPSGLERSPSWQARLQ